MTQVRPDGTRPGWPGRESGAPGQPGGRQDGPAGRLAATRRASRDGSGPAMVPGGHDAPRPGGAGVRVPPFVQKGSDMKGQWPLRDFLELGALDSAVPCARLHARQVLWEWRIASFGEPAELVVCELITNAVKASLKLNGASPVRLWLASDSDRVLILVWDASPRPPVRIDAGDQAENGRGLMLVEAMSERWGWYARENTTGKFVWATLAAS